jgi:hypothetical protein
MAAQQGPAELVTLLLQDGRVNPADKNNFAIRNAASQGKLDVVKILLGDNRIDLHAEDNYAIRLAMANNHTEVVRFLIPKVDISKITNEKARAQIENIATQMKLEEQMRNIMQNNETNKSANILSREDAVIEITRLMENFHILKIGKNGTDITLKYKNVEIK